MKKVLVTETVHEAGPELLRAQGCTVVYADRDMEVIRREIGCRNILACLAGEEPAGRLV